MNAHAAAMSARPGAHDLGFALLNDWQRGFPLSAAPYADIAATLGVSEAEVLHEFARLQAEGSVSRIGAVWGAGAGGAAMLCALAAPPERLEAVAALVSAEPSVNHNYEREHHWNLWFVVTAPDRAALDAVVDRIEAGTGLPLLRLRMVRAYRIDLGFALEADAAPGVAPAPAVRVEPVAEAERALAALVEAGLPLVPRPYDDWAARLGQPAEAVLATLTRWQRTGTVRRYGVIVRHHELGITHNAMTVFQVPDDEVDACGARLAQQPGVTLCYRRERGPGWPYTLYCMVHGRDRAAVQRLIAQAIDGAGLQSYEHAVLFSRRRYKQQGARYFRAAAAPATSEVCHAHG